MDRNRSFEFEQCFLRRRILAAVLGRPLTRHAGGEVCAAPPADRVAAPEEELAARLAGRLERGRALYRVLAPEMRRFDGA